MNPQDLLNQADKNIREETQAVVDMLYEDVRKKYVSLVGAINISVNLVYYSVDTIQIPDKKFMPTSKVIVEGLEMSPE